VQAGVERPRPGGRHAALLAELGVRPERDARVGLPQVGECLARPKFLADVHRHRAGVAEVGPDPPLVTERKQILDDLHLVFDI
jgi:hypothetical protein